MTLPDGHSIRKIRGDGNCLFRAMSYIITGSEDQHLAIRHAITTHMLSIPELLTDLGADGSESCLEYYNGGYSSVEQYLEQTRMAESGMWGTDFEMSLFIYCKLWGTDFEMSVFIYCKLLSTLTMQPVAIGLLALLTALTKQFQRT